MGEELFDGEGAGCCSPATPRTPTLPVDAPGSGAYGWLLAMLGQQHGFPVPVGGAGELAAALARRAESAGATMRTGQRVERIDVRGGRAVGRAHRGRADRAGAPRGDRRRRRPTLYRDLLPADALPPGCSTTSTASMGHRRSSR